MNVPVLWVHHDQEGMARGYWDEGFLEALFARQIWTPPGAFTYEHYEVHGDFPDAIGGAVVVLPARHHVNHVAWFKAQLDRLVWSVVILAGDEEWDFPWQEIEETSSQRVWIMQPRPEHAHLSGLIPGGWYPGTHEGVMAGRAADTPRLLDWFFAGQVTHVRRESCVEVLRSMDGGELIETQGYTQGIPQDEYWRKLASAKVIPCPSGPESVDTARAFEALEAGCVPMGDLLKPHERHSPQFDYWNLLFGKKIMPTISDWHTLPDRLAEELGRWPHNANIAFSGWQQWKRNIAIKLDDDVAAVSGLLQLPADANDWITVIITTSPVAMHPSTEHIETTIDSIRERLPRAEIIIQADGVRPEDAQLWYQYQDYLQRLLWLTNNKYDNIVVYMAETWLHQALCVKEALTHVITPFVLMVEHDTPLSRDIPWDLFLEALGDGTANMVRLHHEAEILPDHKVMFLDEWANAELFVQTGLLAVRTVAWWQRPHVARTDFYRSIMNRYFGADARCFVEDVMYGVVTNDWNDYGEPGWDNWRLWVYAPEGSMQTSWHLDSRQETPKYDQVFDIP